MKFPERNGCVVFISVGCFVVFELF